jgi:hypothetical protein
MTDDEFKQRKLALDRQLEAGIALLRDSHRTQVQALEQLWMMTRHQPTPPPAAAPPPSDPIPVPRPKRRPTGELLAEVLAIFDALPEVFDRRDVCRSLGYVPDRLRLFRVFRRLEDEGRIAYKEYGSGRMPAIYRKRDRSERGGNRSTGAPER